MCESVQLDNDVRGTHVDEQAGGRGLNYQPIGAFPLYGTAAAAPFHSARPEGW
jgi:hypothetical protein